MAIKTQPDDFIVDEELGAQFLAGVSPQRGRFALYAVRKRSLTTHEMLDRLARRLKVPLESLAAAGLKDKQAVTTQHVTLRVDAGDRLPPELIEADGYSASLIGYVAEAIDSQAIARNRFRIVVRARGESAIGDMRDGAKRYARSNDPRSLSIVNYFGNQRFGSARAGQGFIAAHLVRGEFEQALKLAIATPHRKDERRVKAFKQRVADAWSSRNWKAANRDMPRVAERAATDHLIKKPDDFRGAFAALPYFFQQLCVEAYQSLLWNRIAATLLIDRLGDSGRLWVVDDTYGQLVFPEVDAVPADLRELDLPMMGRKSSLLEPWKAAAMRVLAEERLQGPASLRIPGMDKPWFGESPRLLFMQVEDFQIGPTKTDEMSSRNERGVKTTTTFTLPRGGYATVLLRALGQ